MEQTQTMIMRLPNEILDSILQLTMQLPLSSLNDIGVSRAAVNLSRVCRRFHGIATPYIYAHLLIYCNNDIMALSNTVYEFQRQFRSNQLCRSKLLHRTLQKNPQLWQHCRNLKIELFNDSDSLGNIFIATDAVTWLTGVTNLSISSEGRTTTDAMALVRSALGGMKELISLSVKDVSGDGIDLPLIVDAICCSGKVARLKTLNISGISRTGNSADWAKLREIRGTASFTELTLHSFLQTPEALKSLLMWPARLDKFTLDTSFRCDYALNGLYDQWGLDTLQPILTVHKSTLSAIRIRALNRSGLDGFNLSGFQALRELSLSHGLTGTDPTLVAGLLSPRLRSFHWDMTFEDQQHDEFFFHFGEPEENWLRKLAMAAIGRKSTLEIISIKFRPTDGEWGCTVYPWDRMDDVARYVQPYGIRLFYTTPTISRELFLEAQEFYGTR
ncbi:hypothetical protein N5P37_011767 [Trichoderma harzianum]|uniref:Uncharacterized protein n=1 Tax=Trichoderma harzianum CBS 226.95 TaxID=983964 RepID=A0A2T3ZRC8_TRIHA|nr:hypothetical protein M431DRAFT_22005 [Trichoderma harzianum CBS 226.95]KAK0755688.1 hypothetical protein N5P37_011767 [Trichoderma harzianum]PTB47365.1 hypothetical protein M431DRAFT_22005 [Trichoderma harzianum CBS 226.95]